MRAICQRFGMTGVVAAALFGAGNCGPGHKPGADVRAGGARVIRFRGSLYSMTARRTRARYVRPRTLA